MLVCSLARPRAENGGSPALRPDPAPNIEAAKCPEPLCPARVLPLPERHQVPLRGALLPLHRAYGLTRQTAFLLLPSALASAVGLCRLLPAPAGVRPFPALFRKSFPACLDPYSGCPRGARARYFPLGFGLPQNLSGSALGGCRPATSGRAKFSELQSFANVQARGFARHPGRSHRLRVHPRRAAVTFTSEQNTIRCLLVHRTCLPSESGN